MKVLNLSGKKVFVFDSLSSTMDTARTLGETEDEPVVVALTQKTGRGRHGRVWLSPEGGLWCSVVWKHVPEELFPYLFYIASAAVVELLASYGIQANIKLPNDVLWKGKKIAGLLVENSGESVIIGIGINVNNTMRSLQDNAISCTEITGKEEDLLVMLERLLDTMEHYRASFPQNEQIFLQQWGDLLKT
jgi:BirA family biotin operon repressor/biotin-[acetyl-CoA-carboxylase] ligase